MRRPEFALMDAEFAHGREHPAENFFVTGILGGEIPHSKYERRSLRQSYPPPNQWLEARPMPAAH